MRKVAIITGASSGIGREFALQIAQRYRTIDEIWLIARRKDRLAEVKTEINAALKVGFQQPVGLYISASTSRFNKP